MWVLAIVTAIMKPVRYVVHILSSAPSSGGSVFGFPIAYAPILREEREPRKQKGWPWGPHIFSPVSKPEMLLFPWAQLSGFLDYIL